MTMRAFRWVGLLVVLGLGHAAILRPMTRAKHPPADDVEPRPTDSWDQRLESQGKESRFVVQGRITQVESNEHPEAKTISLGTIEVTRHLKKGVSDLRTIPVEFRSDSYLDMTPDTEDVIWFVRERQSNGRYLVTDWKWGLDSLHRIMAAVARVDRTPLPNMSKPRAADQPISVVLAADDGQGRASTEIGLRSFGDNHFLIQFENHGPESLRRDDLLYGSLWRSKYPHYDLEIVDEQGQRNSPGAVRGLWHRRDVTAADERYRLDRAGGGLQDGDPRLHAQDGCPCIGAGHLQGEAQVHRQTRCVRASTPTQAERPVARRGDEVTVGGGGPIELDHRPYRAEGAALTNFSSDTKDLRT